MSDKNNHIQKTSVKSVDKFRIITEDRKLSDYLNETLETQDFRKKKKENKKLTIVEARKIKSNDDKKVGILDKHIFGSMANLICFFRFMFRHPELIDRFGEDIEELLGLKVDSNRGEAKFQGLGFEALVTLILRYPSNHPINNEYSLHNSLNKEQFNFKRHLLPILQGCIYARITEILSDNKRDMLFKMMVDNDFQRTDTWTKLVDKEPRHMNKPLRRKIIV